MRRGRKPGSPGTAQGGGRMPKEKLAQAIDPIAEDYVTFMQTHAEGEQPGDSKAFAARHSAGLAALHHLTELAALVSGEAAPDALADNVEKVLQGARSRMAEEDGA